MTDEEIVVFLDRLLIDKGKSQTEIADEIGISRQVLWHLLNKKGTIHYVTRKKIERYAKKIG